MSMKIFDASADLLPLQPCTAKNNMLGFETAAVQITEKNMATAAIMFNSNVWQDGDGYVIAFRAKRSYEDSRDHDVLKVRETDWIIVLDDELRVIPDRLFSRAFTTDRVIEFRCSVCGKISGDTESGSYGEKHPLYQIATIPGVPQNVLADCNMDLKV